MLSQRILTRNPRTDAYLDLAESSSGVILAGFLWSHMLFVCTILLGAGTFNGLSEFFDAYYLPHMGIPVVIVIFFMHFVIAGRRIPTKIRDQRIVWRHAKLLRHFDTWTWIIQVITGMSILVVASIHMWMIVTGWPIRSPISADRVHEFWWMYVILLIIGELHAGIGIYRVIVKWSNARRKPVNWLLNLVTIIMFALGAGALWTFFKIGGAL